MKIFINPGHMPGVDSGAVNKTYGVTEADIVKEIGAGVQQYLNRVGYDCMLVQSDNLCGESPNYTNICASANGWKADLFLSIHCNAAAEEAQGTETLVYSRDSKGACALMFRYSAIRECSARRSSSSTCPMKACH